jgi:ADP-heptose:LPS heptosyltransferase
MRVVVFHQGALGDFLLAASAIDELFGEHCQARVDFWSKPEHVSLLAGKSYLREVYRPDTALIACLLHDDLWRTTVLPDFLLEADRLFIFGQTGSRLMAERLSGRVSARIAWIQSFPSSEDARIHVSDFIRMQFNALGLPIGGKPITLSPPVSEKMAARDLFRECEAGPGPIVVHPGSGGRRKVWPLRNWHGLLDWAGRKLSSRVVLSVGPADECLSEFTAAMRKTGIPIISGLTPLRLSAILSLCGLYIGSDSGVSHLAAAVGIPAIIVFGPTDPLVWGPKGERTTTVRRQWKEEDLLLWSPSEKPEFHDEELINIIRHYESSVRL